MTRDKIISDLFISKDFTGCISKMKPENLQEELKSEVALILCEMNEEKILNLYNSGGLKFYTVRIILNLIKSSTSPFHKKFRRSKVDMDFGASKGVIDPFQVVEKWDGLEKEYGGGYTKRNNQMENLRGALSAHPDSYDNRPDIAIEEIEHLYWYDREIIKLYGKLGTYRAVETETGIPFESIYKTVQKACKEIRKKVA